MIWCLSRNIMSNIIKCEFKNRFVNGEQVLSNWPIISIYSLDLDKGPVSSDKVPILPLKFADITPENFKWYKNLHENEYDCSEDLFNNKHASEIYDFINLYKPENLYIHCFAGQSRSVAVAKALSTYLDNPYSIYGGFDNTNKYVYKTMKDYLCQH